MKINPLPFHVYDELHSLRGRCSSAEDAIALVASLYDGATIYVYPRGKEARCVYLKGRHNPPMSHDACIAEIEAKRRQR